MGADGVRRGVGRSAKYLKERFTNSQPYLYKIGPQYTNVLCKMAPFPSVLSDSLSLVSHEAGGQFRNIINGDSKLIETTDLFPSGKSA